MVMTVTLGVFLPVPAHAPTSVNLQHYIDSASLQLCPAQTACSMSLLDTCRLEAKAAGDKSISSIANSDAHCRRHLGPFLLLSRKESSSEEAIDLVVDSILYGF